MQVNPRKIMQKDINEVFDRVNQMAGGMSLIMKKLEHIDTNMGGLEEIVMKLAEFLGKRAEFNDYLHKWLESEEKNKSTSDETLNKKKVTKS